MYAPTTTDSRVCRMGFQQIVNFRHFQGSWSDESLNNKRKGGV